jgi:hypothetical protein
MKSKMTIGKKLFLSIAAALTLTLVLGIDALLSIRGLSASLNTVVEVNAEKLYLASDMNTVLSGGPLQGPASRISRRSSDSTRNLAWARSDSSSAWMLSCP